MDSLTISTPLSKRTGFEDSEMSAAYFEDLKGRNNDAISNEMIRNGDPVLDTYKVTSDAIPGGMGSVWRVHHNGWDTDLAMKRPQPRFFSEGSDRAKKQFVEECENWINLGLHPNIVSCYYVREIGGVPTIFSEWMDNGSLSDRIKDGTLYEGSEDDVQERILNIAIQAAGGLQYSHENNLIHQDMKPGNLLLTREWGAKVADFGLAKAKSGLGGPSETAKTSGYTLAYCPAEQVNREEPARWMDIYAWALTVLTMYAGKILWSSGAEAKENLEGYFTQCAHRIPGKMKELVESCLTDKPDTFHDIKKRLLDIYQEMNNRDYADIDFSLLSDSAENLNNRALSFLDLRQEEDAGKCWEKALAKNPDHTESVINNILFKWYYNRFDERRSFPIDQYAVDNLKYNNHNDLYSVRVLLYVSILRGSREDALAYLDSLEALGADQDECAKLKTMNEEKCGEPQLIARFSLKDIPIASTEDGDIALLGKTGDYVRIVSTASKKIKGDFQYTHNQEISFALFDHSGTFLVLCGKGGITVWDIRQRKRLFAHTGRHVLYAHFDEEKQQIAALYKADDRDHREGALYNLRDGKEAGPLRMHEIPDDGEYKTKMFFKENGTRFLTMPDEQSIVDCSLDEEGRTKYEFYPSRIRKHVRNQVFFRVKDTGIAVMKQSHKLELRLNTDLLSVKKENGFEIYRLPVPDIVMLPHMELSRIHSVLEQIREKEKYLVYIREAEQLAEGKNYFEALKRIDAILALKNHEHDPAALALRSELDAHLTNKTFLKCIELRDYDGQLPPASPGTYPEAPQTIFDKAVNCLSIDDAQEDYAGNLMASLLAKSLQLSDYPIQKVYRTAYEHIFVCCGWKHEHKTVGRTPDYDPIIQDSTEYRLSLYNDIEDRRKVFPPFSYARISELYLDEDRGYKYQMFVAYNDEYHRLVGGNEDYDSPRVTWDTETQAQVAEVDQVTSSILQLSNPRYYLTSSTNKIYIVDLKDNAIVWTDNVKFGRHIKYRGTIRFDRKKDIVQFEMEDGSFQSVQVLWAYEAEKELVNTQTASEGKKKELEKKETSSGTPAKKKTSTVDATLYVDDTKNFVIQDGVLKKYTGKKSEIVIPETVSAMDDGLFSGNEKIESVTIPDSVTKIGRRVFEGCKKLKDVTIPESMEYIGEYAFSGCESLKTVVVPDSVADMGEGVFAECSGLSSVKLPEGLTQISKRLFYNCSFLRGVYIPEDVTVIGEEAFKNCTFMGRITIPEVVAVIKAGAFEGCAMMDAIEDISSDLETIEDDAFRSCLSLSYVPLSYAYCLKHIGNRAFRDCRKLSSIHIPSTVESIGEEAFFGCGNLKCVTIPEGVKTIGENAFASVNEDFVLDDKRGGEKNPEPSSVQAAEKKDAGISQAPLEIQQTAEPLKKDTEKKTEKRGFFSRIFGGKK